MENSLTRTHLIEHTILTMVCFHVMMEQDRGVSRGLPPGAAARHDGGGAIRHAAQERQLHQGPARRRVRGAILRPTSRVSMCLTVVLTCFLCAGVCLDVRHVARGEQGLRARGRVRRLHVRYTRCLVKPKIDRIELLLRILSHLVHRACRLEGRAPSSRASATTCCRRTTARSCRTACTPTARSSATCWTARMASCSADTSSMSPSARPAGLSYAGARFECPKSRRTIS